MLNFLKKYWVFILLAFLIGLILFLKFFFRVKEEENYLPTPSPTPTIISNFPNWQNLFPGLTSKKELEDKFGPPIKKEDSPTQEIYYYSSEKENWPNQIFVSKEEEKIELIKEYFPKEKYEQFLKNYGSSEKEMYNSYFQAGFSVFVFAKNGVAIVANQNSGLVLEVWYFPPTDLSTFLSHWGKDLILTPPQKF